MCHLARKVNIDLESNSRSQQMLPAPQTERKQAHEGWAVFSSVSEGGSTFLVSEWSHFLGFRGQNPHCPGLRDRAATLVSPEDRALGQEDYSQASHSHQFVLASFKLDWDPFLFLKFIPFGAGMSILCLSHHCCLIERSFAPG